MLHDVLMLVTAWAVSDEKGSLASQAWQIFVMIEHCACDAVYQVSPGCAFCSERTAKQLVFGCTYRYSADTCLMCAPRNVDIEACFFRNVFWPNEMIPIAIR